MAARFSGFDERQFATLGTFARAIDGNVMIMARRIVTAGALAGSIEDASDVRVRSQASEIPDNGGGLRIQNLNMQIAQQDGEFVETGQIRNIRVAAVVTLHAALVDDRFDGRFIDRAVMATAPASHLSAGAVIGCALNAIGAVFSSPAVGG